KRNKHPHFLFYRKSNQNHVLPASMDPIGLPHPIKSDLSHSHMQERTHQFFSFPNEVLPLNNSKFYSYNPHQNLKKKHLFPNAYLSKNAFQDFYQSQYKTWLGEKV